MLAAIAAAFNAAVAQCGLLAGVPFIGAALVIACQVAAGLAAAQARAAALAWFKAWLAKC